jgi:hypothetical protein
MITGTPEKFALVNPPRVEKPMAVETDGHNEE